VLVHFVHASEDEEEAKNEIEKYFGDKIFEY
jgi:nucleoside diphosphate kinase